MIELHWFGIRAPVLVPSQVSISAKPNQVSRRQFTVLYVGGAELELKSLANPNICLKWEIASNIDRGDDPKLVPMKGYSESLGVSLHLVSPGELGDHVVETTLRCTQGGKEYDLPLLLKFEVLGPIVTKPPRVFLGARSLEELVGQKFRVSVIANNKLFIETMPDFLECKLEQVGREYVLEGRIKSPPPQKLSGFSIVLSNSCGDSSVLMGRLIVGNLGAFKGP